MENGKLPELKSRAIALSLFSEIINFQLSILRVVVQFESGGGFQLDFSLRSK